MNGIVNMQSGSPLALTTSSNNLYALGGTQRPNSSGFSGAKSGRIQDRLNEYMDPGAFSHPGPFNVGG